ncbi:hypothetical protein [uncultured Pseudomonas sp.]|uniref:hypothetical protein n=1 Tax=uncultured Pseudomonas sp. TaxID=114707 RepID=UPI0025873701|nr:hypothetical protein [uncultured Pseudomonas sp.]
MLVSFEGGVDGYLLDARPREGGYRAAIFFDSSGRYGNGDTLNTGKVVDVSERQGYHLITTTDGSRYVVVSYMLMLIDDSAPGEQYHIVSLRHGGGSGLAD